ncbi:hypothetical protein RZS08_64750, partial [Arthrospira platensis SPKY1]|nr:hypothetical protein [Arthrospira platensis SPKY1]
RGEPTGAEVEQEGGRVLVECVECVVAGDVPSRARELVQQAEMAGVHRQRQRQPLLEPLAVLGAHDGGRAQPQRDATRSQRGRQVLHRAQRRRGMPEERIE